MAVVAGALLIAVGGCGSGELLGSIGPDVGQHHRPRDTGGVGSDQGHADSGQTGVDAGPDAFDGTVADTDPVADAGSLDTGLPPDAGPLPVPHPNVIVVIVDDLGWTDTKGYGSTFHETPSIDRLAAEGVRFTQFYTASPVCSPTRASIMTGKHPARINLTNYIGGELKGKLLQADYIRQLPRGEVTIGEAFKAAGYKTGYIGKWHLGAEGFLPDVQGFDTMLAVNHAGSPGSYFYPYKNSAAPWNNIPDLDDGVSGEYLTDRLTDEALRFLQDNRNERFMLVFSHYAVHIPLQSKKPLTDKYTAKASGLPPLGGPPTRPEGTLGVTKQRQDNPVYAGMVDSTDQSVGRVLDELEKLGLESNTVVVFVSDNGGLSTFKVGRAGQPPTSVLPLRAGKGFLYEGGIRVPLIIKWPNAVGAGTKISTPSTSMDLYPTLLQVAGLPLRPNQHRDGISLVPALRKSGPLQRQRLYWHHPHYHGSGNVPSGAIREGNYKLVEWFEDGRVELYNLASDTSESKNLASSMPSKANELRSHLRAWRTQVGARMPKPNPNWSP